MKGLLHDLILGIDTGKTVELSALDHIGYCKFQGSYRKSNGLVVKLRSKEGGKAKSIAQEGTR